MKRIIVWLIGALAMMSMAPGAIAADTVYVGVKNCTKCHKPQGKSWAETAHAKSFESLQAGAKADAKKAAKLDPAKDYTQDKECLTCHTTGFGTATGFKVGMNPGGKKSMGSVNCESCHGAGKIYRAEHGKAQSLMKKKSESTARNILVETGQNFAYEQACAKCHLSYEGSSYQEAKPPYTPFTPNVDPKYHFEFDKFVRNGSAMHEHYKLKDIFTGDPVPSIRVELQKTAKDTLK
jgi:hypothetical protein